MKIAAATSYLPAPQHAQFPIAACNDRASFSAVLNTATAGASGPGGQGATHADFTSMTRQELQAWSNEQIRSGKCRWMTPGR